MWTRISGSVNKMIGCHTWKVTEVVSHRYDILIYADSEEGAMALAQALSKDKWNDLTDERAPDDIEVELYE